MTEAAHTDVAIEATDLALDLASELEASELAKNAAEQRVKELERELEEEREITKAAAPTVTVPSELMGSIFRLEEAGIVKAGRSVEVYDAIKQDPSKAFSLLEQVSQSFNSFSSEGGSFEKQADDASSKEGVYIDEHGWSNLLKKRNR